MPGGATGNAAPWAHDMLHMIRVALASLAVLAVAGCGGNTPAEEAYLAELTERYSVIKIKDPAREIEIGHAACDEMANTKPAERSRTASIMRWDVPPFNALNVGSAFRHLCPEMAGYAI